MDEENKVEEQPKEEESKKVKKEKTSQSGGSGVSTGLQFLILLVMVTMVGLQYFQFEKVVDIEKRLNEEGKLVSGTEKNDIDLSSVTLFKVVDGGTYNVMLGSTEKYLKMTVNLGLNSKAKTYKNDSQALVDKIEIVKEVIEQIVTSTDLSYFDGGDKEYTVKQRIIDEMNKKFNTSVVVDVYFSDKIKA